MKIYSYLQVQVSLKRLYWLVKRLYWLHCFLQSLSNEDSEKEVWQKSNKFCKFGGWETLVGYSFSDDVPKEIPYEVDVLLNQPILHIIFYYWAS